LQQLCDLIYTPGLELLQHFLFGLLARKIALTNDSGKRRKHEEAA
jgi:hypothetical protein